MLNPLSFISKFIKSSNQRELDRLSKIVSKINSLEEEFINLKDSDFPNKTLEFKEKIKQGKTLDEILPEAFAVVKDTARRFYENDSIKVSATDFDKEIGSKKTYVSIDGESAIWKNSWDAAGKNVLWDMIHYDVQLIGGIVLHQGKIGEMQTGEGKTLVSTLPIYLNALTANKNLVQI